MCGTASQHRARVFQPCTRRLVAAASTSRLVTSRHTHTHVDACIHMGMTYLREESRGSRVLNEPSPSPLPSPMCETDAGSGRSAVARCLAHEALVTFFLPTHPPPPCGALLFTLSVPVHGMWIRPSYPHTSFPEGYHIPALAMNV